MTLIFASTTTLSICITPSVSDARVKSIYAGDPDGTGNESPQPSSGSKSTNLVYGVQSKRLTRETRLQSARPETLALSWPWIRAFLELYLRQSLR